IGEDQEGGTVRPQSADREAAQDRAHGVLADAEMQIASGFPGREVFRFRKREQRLGRWGEITGAADQPRIVLGNCIERLAAGFPRAGALGICRKGRKLRVPSVRHLTALDALEIFGEIGMARSIVFEAPVPGLALAPAALADAASELLVDAVGHSEMRVLRPAVIALGKAHLLLPEGLAVRGGGVLLAWRAEPHGAVDDNQGRTIVRGLEYRERLLDCRRVIRVRDVKHRPAVAVESSPDVLAERQRRVALDRDMIVVVDPTQVRQLEMAGD